MAIHIRHRREALLRMRRQLITASLLLALFCVLTGGVTLFFIREYHRETVTSFRAVEYVPEIGEEQEESRESSSSSSRSVETAASESTPDVLVADTPSAVTLDEMSLLDGDTGEDGGDGAFSLEMGLGSGNGGGSGKGSGTGRGGKHGLGLNNDIQIVLVLDASGSMDYLFREVYESMDRMIETLRRSRVGGRAASVNVGIVAYGAARNNGAPWKLSPFTTRTDTLRRELSRVACDGMDECCGAAIAYAVNEFKWNRRPDTRALKVIVLAGNEEFYQGSVDARSAIVAMRREGIILNTIHCGSSNFECEQWQEAARLGGGVYMELEEGSAGGNKHESFAANYGALLREMSALPVLPLGSPAEQEKRLAQWEKIRKALPGDNKKVPDWVEKNAPWLAMPAWDAAEQYRRMGDTATLAELGGRGNLPASLRTLPEARITEQLKEAAAKRQQLLNRMRELEANDQDLGLKILRAVREQGRSRGIIMKL